jgi:hypothetical protein
MTISSRLPGVYFETVLPKPGGLLPRMDIAAFAGFAASGPLDLPVAVEDAVRFQEIFGNDAALAWDPARNRTIWAQLPSAVRAFFRNGGRRCWVVRIAEGAQLNTFAIPGLLRAEGGSAQQALATARSEGSWSDGLAVNATLTSTPVAFSGTVANGVLPGEMVRLAFSDTQSLAFLPVPEPAIPEYGGRKLLRRSVTLDPTAGYWFRSAAASDFGASSGVVHLPGNANDYPFLVSGGEFMFRVSRLESAAFPPGTMVQLRLTGALPGAFGDRLWVQVNETNSGHGPGAGDDVWVVALQAWWPLDPTAAWAANGLLTPQAAIVAMELWVHDPNGSLARQGDLALVPGHERFWGYLPTDTDLFTISRQPQNLPGNTLRQIADHPRFPLAAPSGADAATYLPLGIFGQLNEEFYQNAAPLEGTSLERDGLANMTAALFLDPDLAGSGATTLLDAAFFKQYQQPRADSGAFEGVPLTRMHALLPIEEASLLAVPDAIQPAWEKVLPVQTVVAPPQLNPIAAPDRSAQATASWSAVANADSYLLEQSTDPLFASIRQTFPAGGNSVVMQFDPAECLTELYYRVRANGLSGAGAWSNTERQDFPKGQFLACAPGTLDAPVLNPPAEQEGRISLAWSAVDGASLYILETADDPALALPSVVYQGDRVAFTIWKSGDALSYFHVRAVQNGVSSPWSNTVSTVSAPVPSWQLQSELPDTVSARILTLHQAMLRMGAARGDMFVLLSLPEAWREEEALAHKLALRTAQAGPDEERALSFGAIYHPWLTVSEYDGPPDVSIRYVPPDGAVCGTYAARTLAGGAWFAAANQALRSVVALQPELGPSAALDFFNAQLNLVLSDPRGFLVMSSQTLSPDLDLRQINVRRLLMLLRRVALREGARLVFEPNDRAFQRRVQRHFERVLSGLFERGAFAGDTSEQAYRVVTDASINTQESMDQGRFIVELRVAPSLPLAFLTVRLVQTGAEILLQETR